MNILRFVIGDSPHGLSPVKSDIFGAAIGATAQHISDAFNYLNVKNTNEVNAQNVADTNAMNLRIAQENNALQARMNDLNNKFSHDEAELSYKRQRELLERQLAWSDPSNQVKLMREAGINPAVVHGSIGNSASSAPSTAQASPHGSGISPSMPTLHAAHADAFQMVSPAAALKDIGQAFEALSKSDSNKLETEIRSAAKQDILRKYGADAALAEGQSIVVNYYGTQEASARVLKIKNEATEAFYNALLLQKQGKTEDAMAELRRAQVNTEKQTAALRGHEAENVANQNKVFFELADGQLKQMSAAANASNAAAQNYRASASLTDEQRSQLAAMRDYNIRHKAAITQMNEAELRKTAATLDSQISYLLGHFEFLDESQKAELKSLQSQLQVQKNVENTWFVSYVFDKLERINNGITNWIPFAPDKESTSRSEVYTDDGQGMRSRTVVTDRFSGKSLR